MTRKRSEFPQLQGQPPLLLGVDQACSLHLRPLPSCRAVARKELDSEDALAPSSLLLTSRQLGLY